MDHDTFFQEILVSFGFFGGVWSTLKVDPERVLLHTLVEVIVELSSDGSGQSLFLLVDITLLLALLGALAGAFRYGRWVGVGAFFSMWAAGFFLVSGGEAGILFLFLGWGMGLYVERNKGRARRHRSGFPRWLAKISHVPS